jgi:enamine deaminase RidA (YjgF/YER057c/UK114 family)
MNRKNIAGSSPWEDIVGYSRMVVVDDCVEVAGTTAMKDGKVYVHQAMLTNKPNIF